MKNILKQLTTNVLALGFVALALIYSSHFINTPQTHAAFTPVMGSTYVVSSAVLSGTQTTVTLASFKGIDGTPFTMANFGYVGYGTLDPNNILRLESISFTGITQNADGTATLTGVSRGLMFVSPYTASSTLARVHLVGAQFVLSNTSAFYGNEFGEVNGTNIIWPTSSSTIASKGYVDYTAFNGAAVIPATTIAPGVSQLATGVQAASSTVTNGAGYNLVLPSSIATSTYNSATAALKVVVTGGGGKIDNNFIATSTLGFANALNIQTFTASSTWTMPSLCTNSVTAYLIGGGGGGGGGGNNGTNATGGQGGGDGAFVFGTFPVANVPSSVFVTVGIGGIGGVGGAGNGTAGVVGTTTSFGGLLSASGGAAGNPGVAGSTSSLGNGLATAGMVYTTGGGQGGNTNAAGNAGAASPMSPLTVLGGTVGAAGGSATSTWLIMGGAGGGGAGSEGSGGAGGLYGGGGGGGSGGNGTGGSGGKGAQGIAVITCN